MLELQPDAEPGSLVAHGPIYQRGNYPELEYGAAADAQRLRQLRVTGLTYHFQNERGGNGLNGIRDVHLSLERGSFTVITGRVGSGKTTLLRDLLGLLPQDGGQTFWNDQPVDNPAGFFGPPLSAYVPQIPRLYSDPLRDNILMGLREADVDLEGAIRDAVLEQDVLEMPDGLETVVGPRG